MPDLTITLREAARKYSNLGGPGYDIDVIVLNNMFK